MNRKTFKINRIIAVMLLASVFTFAFVWTNSSASEQSNNAVEKQTSTAEVEEQISIYEPERNADRKMTQAVALKTERRGSPLINLQESKRLETKFVGLSEAVGSFAAEQVEPRAMTNADLNADGAADL